MTLPTLKIIFGMTALMLATGTVAAATITVSTAVPEVSTLAADNKVTVKHIFGVHYYNNEKFSCGTRMEFSDGSAAKNFTLTQSTTPKQVVEERQYKTAGIYTVTLSGYAWGSYVACLGSQTSSTEIKAAVESDKLTAAKSAAKPTPTAMGLSAAGASMVMTNKVDSITTHYPKMMTAADGLDVPFTINGTGGNCVLEVRVNDGMGPLPVQVDVTKFPVTVNLKFKNLPTEHEFTVITVPGVPKLFFGPACDASSATKVFTTYPKPEVKPYITGLFSRGVTSGTDDSARQDEALQVAVDGNVSNEYDSAKQCGWTLFLVNNAGQGKVIAKGAKFGSQIVPAGTLASFTPGVYRLHAKSSVADDTLANQSCGSQADKKFTLIYGAGKITDVQLMGGIAKNSALNTTAGLWITPIINGGQCNYRVTRVVGGNIVYTPAIHVPGVSDKQAVVEYGADETTVQVTVHAIGNDNIADMGCLGSVTKTITVRDDPSLPHVYK